MDRTSRGSVMLKKEIKMSFLEDVFQTTDEIKQNEEKFKSAVEASFHQLDVLVRPYLVTYRMRFYLKFWKGWSRPLPRVLLKLAAAAPCGGLQKRRRHSRRRPMCNSKTKTALPVGAGKAVIVTGICICSKSSRPYNSTEQSV